MCLPSHCSSEDYELLLGQVDVGPFELNYDKGTCRKKVQTVELESPQILATLIFCCLGCLLLVGTVLELRLEDERSTQGRATSVLLCFSVVTNAKKLLDTRTSEDSLTALNGIRFLSMTWIMLAHVFSVFLINAYGNTLHILDDLTKGLAIQVISNSSIAVDSFFFLSGLLVSYTTLKELSKCENRSWKFLSGFYFHRFWRLTPGLAFTILMTFLWPLTGSGPLWKETADRAYTNCVNNWFFSLIYVQNFVPSACIPYTWYLSVEMQLYVMSPLILIYMAKRPKRVFASCLCIILSNVLFIYLVASVLRVIPHLLYDKNVSMMKLVTLIAFIHQQPWGRTGPFFVGICLGYILTFKRNLRISKFGRVGCWILAVFCGVSVIYGMYPWYNGHMPARWIAYMYTATHKPVWAAAVAWVTFSCATGNARLVNKLLSWKVFVPLSRMTYMVYLIHPYVMQTYLGTLRERIIYTHYSQLVMHLGFVVLSFALGFVGSLVVEVPFLALEKVLFRRSSNNRLENEKREDGIEFKDKTILSHKICL